MKNIAPFSVRVKDKKIYNRNVRHLFKKEILTLVFRQVFACASAPRTAPALPHIVEPMETKLWSGGAVRGAVSLLKLVFKQ